MKLPLAGRFSPLGPVGIRLILVSWTVRDLAEGAGVHRNTITRAETSATGYGPADRLLDASSPEEVVRCVDRLGPATPADNANRARLRALYPLLFSESDVGADL